MDTKLISAAEAAELLAAGKAVRAGSPEHKQMMDELWRQVEKKFVFVAGGFGKWIYREKGTDKGALTEESAQKIVDVDFRSPKVVLSYGRKDGRVKMFRESPVLQHVTDVYWSGEDEEFTFAQRMVVDYIATEPGKGRVFDHSQNGVSHRCYNLWSEPQVKPVGEHKYKEPRWFLDIVEEVFGKDSPEGLQAREMEWFLDWCTHIVCNPGEKMPVSVLITSHVHGIGKSTIATVLEYLVDKRNTKELSSDILKSGFHSFVGGTVLAVVHELYEAGNYGFADKLKTWQSEENPFVNYKYGPQQSMRNCLHFLCFSNKSMPLNLEEGDRRWFVFNSPVETKKPSEWFRERRAAWQKPGGQLRWHALGSLRRWFDMRWLEMQRTGRFDAHGLPPMTDGKAHIIEDSRSPFYHRVKLMLDEGELRPTIGSDRVHLSDIDGGFDGTVAAVQPQVKSSDLHSLGFRQKRTGSGHRCWQLPPEYLKAKVWEGKPKLDI